MPGRARALSCVVREQSCLGFTTTRSGSGTSGCRRAPPAVVQAYSSQDAEARWRFLLAAFCDGKSLEELTGLSQLHASAEAVWDDMSDDDAGSD